MKRIQTKITITYIFLTVAVVAAVGLISSFEIESYFTHRLTDELATQADLVLLQLRGDSTLSYSRIDRQLRDFAQTGKIRITLIDSSGAVIDDSEVPPDSVRTMVNHLSRPEVQEAMRNGSGSEMRHSATVGKDFLYMAKRIDFSGMPNPTLRHLRYIRLSLHLEELKAVIGSIRMKVAIAGAVVFVLVILVSIAISRQISKPMESIARNIQEIRNGNFDRHIEIDSDDEIGQVAQAVNELVDKLKSDIVQLKKLEQIRSEFLGNVSHELRTPIFSLQGFIETLLDGAVDDPNVNRDFLRKAYAHASRLNTLLSDLINISQIESGEMRMSFRYFDCGTFLEQVVSEMKPEAEKRNITLTLDRTGGTTDVFGDKERLKQALFNLIDNAVKYTLPNGTITVAYQRKDSMVSIDVSDTGVGIAPEHQSRIFERFYRVDKERSREAGGTGLGLAIVKHIIEAHGSKVEVTSRVGSGSTFSFELKAG